MTTRLRQIVMVAADLESAQREIEQQLGVELCYRDPAVATFGLRNVLFPIGDQFLEVVSPTEPGTTAGRLLERRGGDGGYMVIVDVGDLAPFRERAASGDVRIVYEAVADGIVGLHLHPADIGGAILSIDRPDMPGEWPWAGPAWREHIRTDRVDAVLGVRVEADDPGAMAARWGAVLGVDPVDDVLVLDGGGTIEFVPSGSRGEGVGGFALRASSADHAGTVTICNCRFDLTPISTSPEIAR